MPSDNLRRKSNRIICTHCTDTIPSTVLAYNCPCVSNIVCIRCIKAGNSFPKPPSCTVCVSLLCSNKATATESKCHQCNHVIVKRSFYWSCSAAQCRKSFCESCIPPPKLSKITLLADAPSTPSTSHHPAPTMNAANDSTPSITSGCAAPMPAKHRA